MEVYISENPLFTFQTEIYQRFTKYQKMTQRYSSACREENSISYTVSPSINHTVLSEVVLYVKPKHVKSIKMSIVNGNQNADVAFDFSEPNIELGGDFVEIPEAIGSVISDISDDGEAGDVIAPIPTPAETNADVPAPVHLPETPAQPAQPLINQMMIHCSRDLILQKNRNHDAVKTIVPLMGKGYLTSKFKEANLSFRFDVEFEENYLQVSAEDVPLLMSQYSVAFSNAEIRRFRDASHERLMRRTEFQSIESDTFDLSFLKGKCCGLLLVSSKDMLSGNIRVNDYVSVKFEDVETISHENRYLWIFDADGNLKSLRTGAFQPTAYYDFDDSSELMIESGSTEFTISYVYYDILRYGLGKIELYSQYVPPEPQEPPIVQEPNIIPIMQPVMQPVNIEPIRYTVPTLSRYLNIIERSEKQQAVRCPTLEECVIGYERIGYGKYYYRCGTCNKVFSKENLARWLDTNTTCPHCVSEIGVLPQLYCNTIPGIYLWGALAGILVAAAGIRHVLR